MNLDTVKSFVAGSAIAAWTLVKPGGTAGQVVPCAAATDFIIGVCVQPWGAASGDRVDVAVGDIVDVVAGAAVVAGAPITSDASARAVTAAPSAGSNVRIIGVAYEAADAAGTIFRVIYSPGLMQG